MYIRYGLPIDANLKSMIENLVTSCEESLPPGSQVSLNVGTNGTLARHPNFATTVRVTMGRRTFVAHANGINILENIRNATTRILTQIKKVYGKQEVAARRKHGHSLPEAEQLVS